MNTKSNHREKVATNDYSSGLYEDKKTSNYKTQCLVSKVVRAFALKVKELRLLRRTVNVHHANAAENSNSLYKTETKQFRCVSYL